MSSDGFITCLWFDGQAEEAAAHYVSIFKNSRLGRVTHYGEGMPLPAGSVLTAEFEANGQKFIALNGGPEFKFTEAISFQILCEDQSEIDYYWNSLTEGGGEGGQCGWLKDRFGVSWQVEPTALLDMISDPDPQKSARVYAAMMPMGKLDLAALRKAYEGE